MDSNYYFKNNYNCNVLIEYYEENNYGLGFTKTISVEPNETIKLPHNMNSYYNILSEDYSGNIGKFNLTQSSTNNYYYCHIKNDNNNFVLIPNKEHNNHHSM